jgi:hypothetical protein
MEYHLNGLAVRSDLPLPCDPRCASRAINPATDWLRIRRRRLQDFPCALRRVRRQLCYDVGNGILIETAEFLMHIEKDGRTISVDASEQHLELAALWVLGAGMATSAFFRGELPLHGAAVQIDGRPVGILSPPGAGKSTLVWALLQQGALFANDGLLPLRFEPGQQDEQQENGQQEDGQQDGHVTAIPAISLRPRLPRATMRRHRIAMKRCEAVCGGHDGPGKGEFWMPVEAHQYATEPARLAALFVLRPEERAKEAPLARPLTQAAASGMVESSVAGWSFVRRQVSEAWMSAHCLALSRCVPSYEIEYPKTFGMAAEAARVMRRVLRSQSGA